MTTSMYCLYVGFDYTYIDINALAYGIKILFGLTSLVSSRCWGSNIWHRFAPNYQPATLTIRQPRHVCIYVCMYLRTYVFMYICVYVCMYVCVFIYVCMYVCMHVCMYMRVYVRVYVCMYVCMREGDERERGMRERVE